jgi:broad specificity phosphatase PhoE
VRHGESEWTAQGRFQGHSDTPLTETGLRQAQAVGARLAAAPGTSPLPVPDSPPLAIWHSPLLRAAQTAQAIHDAAGGSSTLRPLPTLSELGQGEWEGLTRVEIEARYPGLLDAWHRDPRRHYAPGSEPFDRGVERAQAALDAIMERPASADPEGSGVTSARDWSIVVAHEGILRLIMLQLLGLDERHFWAFPFTPAAVSIVELDAGMGRLRAHNLIELVSAMTGA